MLLLFGLSIHAIKAQTDFASEEEFKKQAAKLFGEEEFEKAYPLYSQLVSLYRKDPNYNYRLGVCMLYASDEKERAITFLEFAAKNKEVEKEAFFYLAKAYHLNYRFDEAIAQYQVYKKTASAAKAERFQVDRQIEMCKNGKKLLRNLTDLPVIEKTELGREDFFRSYDIAEIGGKLLVKPDEKEFRTALDKKKNEKSIIYLATNGSQIYFSSYGDNEQHGKDIYLMKKSPNGEWAKPQILGNTVNTAYDEDFPFLHPNGKVLYFCSKGHNSMGGYDIFRSTLNEETNTWNEPVNMDFPINTPDDDILYVTNADEKKAYFASARSSVAGKISMYHINVERRPIDFAIIKGAIVKNRNNQTLNITITVKNVTDNTILGIFNSNATGSYDIKLPNGGSFLYTVESPDFATQSEVVTVPVQNEFKPLKQEITYELPSDKLIIKNLFDEAVSDSNYLLAMSVIKEKSKLDVSPPTDLFIPTTTKEDSVSAIETATVQNTIPAKTNTKLSNDDIVKIAYQDANVVDTEATNSREQADIALSFANQKNEKAQSKSQEAAALMAAASKTEDNIKKQALTDEANVASKEAEKLNEETVVAFNLAKRIDATAIAKREEADLSQQYAKGLEAAVKSKNSTDALTKLDELEKKLDALSQSNADRFPVLNSYKKEEENKKRELDRAIQASSDLKQEITDNETIINNFKTDAAKTKSAQLKQGLNNQIAELQQENNNKQTEFEQNELKIVKLQKEYSGIKNETELVSNVIDQSKTGSSETAAANVASIDKNKLEQQVNTIKNTNQANNNIAASNTGIANVSTVPTDTSKSNTSANIATNTSAAASNTTAKAFLDINKKYSTDLAVAEKITNEGDREKEKANVLKKWSEAIDEDVAKQKQDYISSTDSEMKALLAKKISDAENSSKEKQTLADQSLVKAEKLKQQNTVAAVSSDKTNTKDNTAKIDTNTDTASSAGNTENKINLSEKQFAYNETSATEEITKANKIKKQADTLEAYSTNLKSKADSETNEDTKKLMLEQSEDILQQSKEKKFQAAELNAKANKTEYTSNKNKLDQSAKSFSTTTSDDITMAEMMTDEALIYFDKSQKLHSRADTSKSYKEKEILLNDAYKNEMIALEKQNKASDIYKNHKTVVAVSSVDTSNNVSSSNTLPVNNNAAVTSNTTAIAFLDINKKYQTELASAEKITNEGDREKGKADVLKKWSEAIDADVIKQKQDLTATSDPKMQALLAKKISDAENSSKEKQTQADQSLAKAETFKQQNIVASSTTENTSTKDTTTTFEKNTSKTLGRDSTRKQFSYKEPSAIEQIVKANALTDEANDLLAQSVVYKLETVDKTSEGTKKERKKQGDDLIKRSQEKNLQSFQLVTMANKTEYGSTQNQIEQLAKITSTNAHPELLKAETLNDESKKYFDKAQEQRKKANLITPYYTKETAVEAAEDNEMIALEKQKEAFDIYKNYNPNYVSSSAANATNADSISSNSNNLVSSNTNTALNTNKASNTTLPVKENTTAIANTNTTVIESTTKAATEKQNTYNEPKALEQIVKADLLNKEADEIMAQSVDLKSQAAKQKNVETKNTIYAQSEELTKEAQDKKLQASQLIAKANTTEYDANQNQLDQLAKASTTNTSPDILKAEIMNDDAKKQFAIAKKQRLEAGLTDSYSTKETELENARKNEMIALEKQKGSLEIYKNHNPNFVASAVNTTNNSTVSNNIVSSENPSALNSNEVVNTTILLNPNINEHSDKTSNSSSSSSDIALNANEVFEQKSEPVYSEKNPIPINKKLPEGLIFKVQIGAFRKPIPQDLFSGMSPITGETTSKGFIRYTVGLFEKFTTADKVKNKIIDLGYKDAFIVAFLNGKRIPINEAYAMAGGIPATVLQINNPNTNTDSKTIVTNNNQSTNEPTAIAKTESVSAIQGLFYTVQVGVFSQPISAARLYNMKPLYTETASNGNLRYYTGIYKSVSRATEAKEMVNDVGIKDAFVTAYYKGKRISMSEAKQYETQGDGVFSTGPDLNKLPVFSSEQKTNLPERTAAIETKQPSANKEEPNTNTATTPVINTTANQNSSALSDSGIVFKVQIGAFNEEVPLDIANKFIKIASRGIKNYKDNNGLTVYTVGNLKTYEEAIILKADVAAESLTDAFIVAYRDGVKIPVEEARKLK